jgi:hypothetical protein
VSYDPLTGLFRRIAATGTRSVVGKVYSTANSHGYICISIHDRKLPAHRLAWLYVHGEWPTLQVDHINGNRADNRIENLRLASAEQNQRNRRFGGDTSSGVKGVNWSRSNNKWVAKCWTNGRQVHIGYFADITAAKAAVTEFRERHHGDFARHE